MAFCRRLSAEFGIIAQHGPGVLKCQSHAINGLDDAIMQIHANPLTLLQDRHPANVGVQTGIFNGCPGAGSDRDK